MALYNANLAGGELGDAVPSQVLAGVTFSSNSGDNQVGTFEPIYQENLGNAVPSQVANGVVFSSASGLNQIGELIPSSVEIDGVKVDGDLKLVKKTSHIQLPDTPALCHISVVFNGELHCFSRGDKNHYKFNGSSWESVSTIPDNNSDDACVHNGEIYLFAHSTYSHKLYKWNGSTWTEVVSSPYGGSMASPMKILEFGNELHVLGSSNSNYSSCHYKLNGTSWTSVSTLPYKYYKKHHAVVYNNEIHVLSGGADSNITSHYKYNGSTWTSVSTLPYNFSEGSTIVYKGKIHILGSQYNYESTSSPRPFLRHCSWNGSTWENENNLPIPFFIGCTSVFDESIHLINTYENRHSPSIRCQVYKLDVPVYEIS